jgi:hypothetical protein
VPRGGDGSAVTAVPAANHHFEKWSDGTIANPRIDVNVAADLTVTANFAVDQYTLTYNAGDNGSITGATPQTVNHGGSGSAVKAVPVAGYHFEKWSDGSNANPRTDVKVTADLAVTANFAINQYTLTYIAGENGAIAGAGRQTVDHGGAGSAVTAEPAAGYHFVAWSDGVATATRTDSDFKSDLALTAVFEINIYTVGGTVSGLVKGTSLVLQNNGGDDLAVTANGNFTFATALPAGRPFAATIITHPTSPNQTCTATGGAGTVADANVTGIKVECKLNTYTVGGTILGLPAGNEVVLRNNKGDDLVVSANGNFTFARALNDGSPYEVTIHDQRLKPKWFCAVDKGAGTVAGSNVTSVEVACFPEAELQAAPGLGKINLKWNSHDFKGALFNLCRAREEIPEGGFSRCEDLQGGVLDTKVSSPRTLSLLANNVTYWLQLEVIHSKGRRTYSKVITATPSGGLNDTGIDWCSDNAANRNQEGARAEKTASCEAAAATHPGQDARYGRDAAARTRKLTKTGSGSAGFDYTKVCMSGEAAGEGKCPPNPGLGEGPDNWACTHDNLTGLTWEVKITEGLRSKDNTYTWYNPDEAVNGGAPGVQKGGRCTGSGCDTHAYVQAINVKRLCGVSDWRLPTRKELLSIVDNGRYKPAIDTSYFPNTPAAYYWSSSPYADQAGSAWQVYFHYGEAYSNDKGQGNQVRLVRQAQ